MSASAVPATPAPRETNTPIRDSLLLTNRHLSHINATLVELTLAVQKLLEAIQGMKFLERWEAEERLGLPHRNGPQARGKG